MKRFFAVLTAVVLQVLVCVPAQAVSTYASGAILMDAESGRILYAQNIHEQRAIASITKLMTALVAAERTENLEQEITILPEWTGIEGSSIYLQADEKITMKGLLYGLLLQSGNDAAMAVACHIAGDAESFAELMNEKARELGMTGSHFVNPSGLSDEAHYSTAYDMALLACACLDNAVVAEICATQSATVGNRTFYNHNKLLHRYEGCVGMKTGYTELAGRTLISAATRNGQTLVCVTLNDGNDWNDHEKLLDYGFETYPAQILCLQSEQFGSVKVEGSLIPSLPVIVGEQVSYPLAEGEKLELTVELAHSVQAPVSAGMAVGRLSWSLNEEIVAETELLCGSAANRDLYQYGGLRERISRWFGKYTIAQNGAHLI